MSMLHSDVNDPEVSQAYRRLRTFANKVARELMAAHATSTPDGWLLHSFCRSDELTYGGGYSPEYKETTEEVLAYADRRPHPEAGHRQSRHGDREQITAPVSRACP